MTADVRPSHRIPSLDGLRALSIGLVMFSHLLATRGFPWGTTVEGTIGEVGYLGVRVFFVISGFLITKLLLRERERTGTVDLKQFFVRRAFRLFPACYVFIGVMLAANSLGLIHLRPWDVHHAVTYTMNYHYERSWELGHLWSLSVEEQFYLLWPALILFLAARGTMWVAVAMVLLAPVCRVIAWYTMEYADDVIMEAYPCVMDSIAAGSLLAMLQPRLMASVRYERIIRSPAFWLLPLLVMALNLPSRVWEDYTIDITLENICIAFMVDRFMRVNRGAAFTFLNLRPLAWIGTLSYSLYLWQEPFLNHRANNTFTAWPVNVAAAFVCAIGSYYLVERPFFALRDVWTRKKS